MEQQYSIEITVNLSTGEEARYNLESESVSEALLAVETLHSGITSIVLVIMPLPPVQR